MRRVGISLALINVAFWFSVPAICAFVDQTTGRRTNANNPQIVTGVQELLVYFDPWLARGVFPIVFTVGVDIRYWINIPEYFWNVYANYRVQKGLRFATLFIFPS